ncbi:hypothetical protein Golomagni_02876 [Golovinomyces magnicellulatus]|nr:hypothetical protein Golomagni_02876 [Golovinomyces magnicellulatus]
MNDSSRTEESSDLEYDQAPTVSAADLTAREDPNEEVSPRTIRSNEYPDKKKIKRKFQNLLMYRINNATSEDKLECGNHKNDDDDNDDYEKRDEEKEDEEKRDEEKGDEEKRNADRDDEKRHDEKRYNETKSNKKDTEKSDGVGSKLDYITELKIPKEQIWNILATLKQYFKLVGPGFMISVAYIDPGNYSVNISAGATFRFKLLYIGLMANLCSIFFHGLCVRLGSVTGYNLAQACRAFLPAWLNIILYIIAEISVGFQTLVSVKYCL